jgi:hypothetical protein
MASEKKPSIYYDRSTIGSSNELDEYGVWVKSEPQDLSPENEEGSLADTENFPDFDMDLILPDQDGEDSFSGANTKEGSILPDDLNTDDLNISDFVFDSFETENLPEFQEKDASFDFSDLPVPDETVLSGGEEAPSFDLAEAAPTETVAEDLFDDSSITEDISPEGGGLEVPKEGREDSPVADLAAGEAEGKAEPEIEPEAEKRSSAPDLSTQLLMKIADELSSIRSELANLKQEFRVLRRDAPPEETGSPRGHGLFDEEDDEKISLTGDELDTILNTADFAEETGGDALAEPAGLEEKKDLSPEDLPESGAEFLSEEPEAGEEIEILPAAEDLSQEAPPPTEEDDFVFEENGDPEIPIDDITIDLDLDLDSSSPEAPNEEDQSPERDEPDTELPLKEISLETGEEQAGENPDFSDEERTDFSIDFVPEPEEALNLNPEETTQLEMLMEEGLEPMTSPPEDTSYLDDDPLVEESFEEISLDLSDAVIDEPDLSGKIKENPPEEPVLENITLDDLSMDELSGDISVDFDMEEAGEEIQISLPEELSEQEEVREPEKAEEIFPQLIPEGFKEEAEDIPDFLEEDISAAEENLLDETAPEKGEDLITEDKKTGGEGSFSAIPSNLQMELKTVLSYMDRLLESLPEEKIEEFAKSEYFDTYKKLFKELGIV